MKRLGVVLCTVFLAGACRIAHAGKLEQFHLSKDCVNPRLVDYEGIPLVYSWEAHEP
jgi:hypothetical protein